MKNVTAHNVIRVASMRVITMLLFVFIVELSNGQSYSVTITGTTDQSMVCGSSYCTSGISGRINGTQGFGIGDEVNVQLSTLGKPSTLVISTSHKEEDGMNHVIIDCNEQKTFNLPLTDCFTSFGVSDYSCTHSYALYVEVKPILSVTSSTIGDYCANETITLTASSGFSSYNWQYNVENGGWVIFTPPGSGNSRTFGIQDIFGGSYESYLDKEILFRYSVGNCDPTSVSAGVGPFTFQPTRPVVSLADGTPPSCKDGINSIIKIKSVSRSLLSGEILTYDVYTSSDVWIGQESSNQQPSDANPIEINGDDSSEALSGIAPGSYKILVQSNLSLCGAVTYYTLPVISNPTQVTFSNTTPVQPLCYGGSNGSITVTASGGTVGSGYQYSKDNGLNYQSSNVLSGLAAGDYTVKVKDGNGCSSTSSTVTVAQPTDITFSSALVTSDYNGSDISCVGSTNGQITVMASGGTGTLNYSKDGTNFQASNIFNSLGANNYTLTVRDGNSCTRSSSPVAIVAPPAITASATPTAAKCNGLASGSIEVINPTGGTGALSYSINGTTFQSSTSFADLEANNYVVTVRDANLCTTTINTTVSQPAAISVTPTPTLVTCSGGSDGSISITTNATGATYSINGVNFQTSNSFTGLSANNYTLTVKDGNGCTGSNNATVSSNPIITGPITVATPISCNGGSNGALNLTPGGGVGPYTFEWSNGAMSEDISSLSVNTYSVIVTDSKNCKQTFNRVLTQPLPITVSATPSDYNGSGVSCFGSNNGSINITSTTGGNAGYTYSWSNGAMTQNINTLTAGTYIVTVTDNKSCTGNQSVTITQPAQLTTAISNAQNIACFGGNTGSITLSTSGGTTAYEYSINDGTNWQSASTFNNLTATAYTILTRDANACPDTDGATLTSPTNLILTVDNVTNTTCNQSNGSAITSSTGGAGTYTYNWFNSSYTQIGANNAINNLTAGVYRVVVRDQNSCSKQQNVTISSSNGPAVTIQSITSASCSNTADGSATISITQGQTPYSILWPNNQTTETATNLAGGDYIVEVRDNTNCLALQTVTIPAPPVLTIQTITEQDPNCNGNSNGEIEVVAQGGNTNYTYNWNTGSTSTTLTSLPAGIYTVTVKDNKNCEATKQYTLTNPQLFTINLGADQKICEGQTIIKESGVDNATYGWTGPNNFTSNQQQVSISTPGTYTLVVINEDGCEAEDSFELSFDTDLLKADFLMVSEAYTGDTVVVIDISWPIPTSVNWQFDAVATIVDQSPDYSLVRYDAPGTYNVTLQAQLAQCASSYNQWITIIDNPNGNGSEEGRSASNLIQSVSIFPNPATALLTVDVVLSQEQNAFIELYNLQSNIRELSRQLEGNSSYLADFKIDYLPSGTYAIIVKAGKETRSVRLMKL